MIEMIIVLLLLLFICFKSTGKEREGEKERKRVIEKDPGDEEK